MKLIKLSSDHYIIVDDSEIKKGDYYWNELDKAVRVNNTINHPYHKKITHSTQLDKGMDNVTFISLSEVKELLDEVDIIKRKDEYLKKVKEEVKDYVQHDRIYILGSSDLAFTEGYNQALEDNKDRVYTEEDMRNLFALTLENAPSTESHTRMISDREYRHFVMDTLFNRLILRFQPKTQWDVQFVDGKIKLI